MLLSQLEYFRVVAKHEHISRAAEELCVAQPAISATISKIEKELGIPLFNRTGRNIELNDAGRRLLKHADYLFAQIAEMEQALVQTKERLENEVIISISNSMFLSGWLQQFVQSSPKIRLQQKMLSEEQMLDALQAETVDIAIGEFSKDVPGIVRKILVEDEYVFTCSPKHRLANRDIVYFEDIRDENVIGLPSNTIYKIADRLYEQKNCKPHIVFEGGQRLMGRALQQNRGILFATRQMLYMPYQSFYKTASMDDFCLVSMQTVADLDCRTQLAICWKEGRELPVMAYKFIEAMEQTYPKYHDSPEYTDMKLVPRFKM